jgi:glycosyltransferase involved in cell wall biosynthesis
VAVLRVHGADHDACARALVAAAVSSNVVLEALASGLPVVTNATGAEGVASNDGVVVAEDNETLARAAVSILSDPEERRQRGVAGLQAFKDGHTPRVAAGMLFELYSRMANSG